MRRLDSKFNYFCETVLLLSRTRTRTFVGPLLDLVTLFLDLVALDLVGPLQVAALNSIQQDCL